ncbi:ABC transporter permease [Kurthia sibirica]|uniref:Uncharacterized protein n=1 Tax=Kurthia sibirica TaxID=202750 RepID=A0A2U3AMX2_9BACL|nr:ABC transporter permease [Kurthia sibirica]PWI25839.1 hypothetical protein DEX24_06450 [Kurthia sibirica]GEK33658.1 ABC transporter permease [Kurthia sibirica]
MNFLKRAFYSMKVKKGRTLLLTVVFSAILIFILAGLTIQSASLKATENAKKSMGATVTLSANMENIFKNAQKSMTEDGEKEKRDFTIPSIDGETVRKLSALDNIDSLSITSSTTVNASSFEAITATEETSTEEDAASGGRGFGGTGMMGGKTSGDISLAGTNDSATASAFLNDTAKITDGVGITSADAGTKNAVIEKNLATENKIVVGDTVKIKNTDEQAYTLKVVGIYESTETADQRSMQIPALNPYNKIYTATDFVNKVKGSTYKDTADSVLFTLTDPEQMTSFVKEAKAAGLDTDMYSLQTNDQVYQQMIEPLKNVESFAQKIVWLVAIAGTIILALIVIITIRERKYEIGVLLSLGEKRLKIIGQFFAELILVLVMALVIAGISGQFVGNYVGQQLLEQQNTTSAATTTTTESQGRPGTINGPGAGGQGQGGPGGQDGGPSIGGFGANNASDAEKIKELDINLSIEELVQLGGLGLGISFLAVILASIGIMRMQPKKILNS